MHTHSSRTECLFLHVFCPPPPSFSCALLRESAGFFTARPSPVYCGFLPARIFFERGRGQPASRESILLSSFCPGPPSPAPHASCWMAHDTPSVSPTCWTILSCLTRTVLQRTRLRSYKGTLVLQSEEDRDHCPRKLLCLVTQLNQKQDR